MKFIDFLKLHSISIFGGFILLFILFYGGLQAYKTSKFNRTITNQAVKANTAVREAANALNAAVNTSIERRTEDAIREKTITPELTRRRRNSENSKIALDEARKTHNEKKSDTSNLSRSDAVNCAALTELFPNIRFEDCQ